MNFDNLKTMTREQLVDLAMKQGLPKPHHKAKPETIIQQIAESALSPKKDLRHVAEKPAAPVHDNTVEDVESVIAPIRERVKQFEARFIDVDGKPSDSPTNWHFMWRDSAGRIRREETGNLAIPLRIIREKAMYVSQGPVQLMGLNNHFDQANAGGLSAYTNTVIAG